MLNNRWFCEPDRYRESWCFIKFDMKKDMHQTEIISWELGYGNPINLTQIKKCKQNMESEIIREILKELSYSKKNRLRVVTVYENDFRILRTRCLQLKIDYVSLQGLKFISLDSIIKRFFDFYFDDENHLFENMVDLLNIPRGDSVVNQLQRIMMGVCSLIPQEVFYEGQP
jgi:hypothetical protein